MIYLAIYLYRSTIYKGKEKRKRNNNNNNNNNTKN